MLLTVNNISYPQKIYQYNPKNSFLSKNLYTARPIEGDSVHFSGKSPASMYSTVFEYLAAEIFSKNKKYGVDGSMLSASKISDAVRDVFSRGTALLPYKNSVADKIKWKSYIPQDIRQFSIDKINEARAERFNKWRDFLINPTLVSDGDFNNPELVSKLKEDKSLRIVIWDAITSEIKDCNRHIPVPLNQAALLETINDFEKFEPKARAVRCAKPSFLEMYTHRLRDNLLMKMNLSGDKPVWVKIPSKKHDEANFEKNIEALETLSCRNWCTRSSVDKARAALEEGDFYIYLKRNSSYMWEPLIGMTTYGGKIEQIQGIDNNNIVPLNLVGEIKTFLKSKNLKCQSGVSDEYPKAYQAILISEKLNETFPELQKSFARAIKDNDTVSMFKYLGIKIKKGNDGLLTIGTYRPSYNLNNESGISVPYSMFGLNEDDLLKDVKIIDGNLVLCNPKNKIFDSLITHFPQNLEKVNGRIECSRAQYEKFGADLERVAQNKIFIHN